MRKSILNAHVVKMLGPQEQSKGKMMAENMKMLEVIGEINTKLEEALSGSPMLQPENLKPS